MAPVGRHDRNMKISILQAQRYHPVSWVQGRQDLSQREHFEFLLFEEEIENSEIEEGRRPLSFFGDQKVAGITTTAYFWDRNPVYSSLGQESNDLLLEN